MPRDSWSRSRRRPKARDGSTRSTRRCTARRARRWRARLGARLGRRFGRDLVLGVADLGWSIRLPDDAAIAPEDLPALLDVNRLDDDVLEGLDRGELPGAAVPASRRNRADDPPQPGAGDAACGSAGCTGPVRGSIRWCERRAPTIRCSVRRAARCSRRPWTSRPLGDGSNRGRRCGSASCRAFRRSPQPGSSRPRPIPSASSRPPRRCAACTSDCC